MRSVAENSLWLLRRQWGCSVSCCSSRAGRCFRCSASPLIPSVSGPVFCLFLSGIGLVQGKTGSSGPAVDSDVAVVPLAMPIIVGPATTGTLLVMGAELDDFSAKAIGCLSLIAAVASISAVLLMASLIHRRLGARGISILSKLTGLVLAALAAQMIMTGIQGFMGIHP